MDKSDAFYAWQVLSCLGINFLGSFTRCPISTLLPFFFWFPLLKPNSRKKGTLIIMGLLEYDLPNGNYIATITILNPTT